MRIRIPSKRICERFHLTYELKGAQKGANVLTEYYKVRRMKITVNDRIVGKWYSAEYFENVAVFTKRGLKKRNVVHELYHHVVESKGIKMLRREEEKNAYAFTREVMKKIREAVKRKYLHSSAKRK